MGRGGGEGAGGEGGGVGAGCGCGGGAQGNSEQFGRATKAGRSRIDTAIRTRRKFGFDVSEMTYTRK